MPGDQNSLFTKHFLSALKGDAGSSNEDVVRVFDIFSYLEKTVSVEAATRNHPQHPVFKSNLENNFPVALRCGGIIMQNQHLLEHPFSSKLDTLINLYVN